MPSTVIKSFRLTIETVKKIQAWAKQEDLSQAEFLQKMIKAYELLQLAEKYEEDVRNMGNDEAYLNEQRNMANEHFDA